MSENGALLNPSKSRSLSSSCSRLNLNFYWGCTSQQAMATARDPRILQVLILRGATWLAIGNPSFARPAWEISSQIKVNEHEHHFQ